MSSANKPSIEPTSEQVKWVWEQCGLSVEDTIFHDKQIGAEFVGTDMPKRIWRDLDGILVSTIDPPIDLKNLFKYAVPFFKSIACGLLNEENWKGAWAKVIPHNGESAWIREEGLTPALALFWAIFSAYKALGGKECQ